LCERNRTSSQGRRREGRILRGQARHGGRDARGKCGRERLAQREPRRIVLGIDPPGDRGEGKTAAAQCAAQLC
jgi:hypothetical protein